ncbi:MAG TPA: class I SAM-dependent methyltransferase [Edaphobacter sp.]|jgi:SAM-dependent methyltransferase|nr:class I SAM-dependent methyltransferase [Edaphobacter sp.]
MGAANTIYHIRKLLTEVGPRQTALTLGRHLYRRAFPVKYPVHPFDLQHGVDTSGLIGGRRLNSGSDHDRHITAYWGTAPSAFRHVLSLWNDSLANSPYSTSDYVFIDIGCGKGRAVMLASEHPFHRVVGVELNTALVTVAQKNLVKWKASPHACHDIEVLTADALEFAFPDSPTLLYVFNPFDAHLTQLLLDRILAVSLTRPAPIDIIYMTPEHAHLFALVPNLQLLAEGRTPLSTEEKAVDAFQTQSLGYCIYHLPRRSAK